jgi:hypothetical protein
MDGIADVLTAAKLGIDGFSGEASNAGAVRTVRNHEAELTPNGWRATLRAYKSSCPRAAGGSHEASFRVDHLHHQ